MTGVRHSIIERDVIHDLMFGMEMSGEKNVIKSVHEWLEKCGRSISINTLSAWKKGLYDDVDKSKALTIREKCKKCGNDVNVTPVAYEYSHTTMEPCGCMLANKDVGVYHCLRHM